MSDQPPEPPSDRPNDWANDPDGSLEPEPDEITAETAADETDVPHPVNWRTLTGEDAEYEWLALNEWVDWLRHEFGLPASIIPPYWHRHPELVWELSALHLHWLGAYDPAQHASAPIGWLGDFHVAQTRLREWVALSGTRLDRDRPTRQTIWPGEQVNPPAPEVAIVNRDEDFVAFVIADVNRRALAEAEFLRRDEPEAEDRS
ncbi:MAG: hypothetical protein ACR2NJ_12885 [Acidimicrobiales bacterium]